MEAPISLLRSYVQAPVLSSEAAAGDHVFVAEDHDDVLPLWFSDCDNSPQPESTPVYNQSMVLTLKVQPELELQLRHAASLSGLDAKSFVLDLLREHLSRAQALPEDLSEKELIAEINRGLSAAEWNRYKELIDKRREEKLTSDEHAELIATTDRLEEANVFRVQYLAELARRRQVSIEALMDELGIKPKIYD